MTSPVAPSILHDLQLGVPASRKRLRESVSERIKQNIDDEKFRFFEITNVASYILSENNQFICVLDTTGTLTLWKVHVATKVWAMTWHVPVFLWHLSNNGRLFATNNPGEIFVIYKARIESIIRRTWTSDGIASLLKPMPHKISEFYFSKSVSHVSEWSFTGTLLKKTHLISKPSQLFGVNENYNIFTLIEKNRRRLQFCVGFLIHNAQTDQQKIYHLNPLKRSIIEAVNLQEHILIVAIKYPKYPKPHTLHFINLSDTTLLNEITLPVEEDERIFSFTLHHSTLYFATYAMRHQTLYSFDIQTKALKTIHHQIASWAPRLALLIKNDQLIYHHEKQNQFCETIYELPTLQIVCEKVTQSYTPEFLESGILVLRDTNTLEIRNYL